MQRVTVLGLAVQAHGTAAAPVLDPAPLEVTLGQVVGVERGLRADSAVQRLAVRAGSAAPAG